MTSTALAQASEGPCRAVERSLRESADPWPGTVRRSPSDISDAGQRRLPPQQGGVSQNGRLAGLARTTAGYVASDSGAALPWPVQLDCARECSRRTWIPAEPESSGEALPFVTKGTEPARSTSPETLFPDLPRSDKGPKDLWAHQADVLRDYLAHVDDADLAIELPTGAGKTLVGVLASQLQPAPP